MKVLVLFESSGRVREAFKAKGHDAWSLDIKESEQPGQHIQCDYKQFPESDKQGWDLVIAHPPCTYLCVSGNRHYAYSEKRMQAIKEVEALWLFPTRHLAIENPVGVLSTLSFLSSPYYIQPWQFGHGETKKTGIWSRGLPQLKPTNIVEGREARVHRVLRSSADRSRTYEGIALAMAEQWSILPSSRLKFKL